MVTLDEAIEIEERLAHKYYEQSSTENFSDDPLYLWQAHEKIVEYLKELKYIKGRICQIE